MDRRIAARAALQTASAASAVHEEKGPQAARSANATASAVAWRVRRVRRRRQRVVQRVPAANASAPVKEAQKTRLQRDRRVAALVVEPTVAAASAARESQSVALVALQTASAASAALERRNAALVVLRTASAASAARAEVGLWAASRAAVAAGRREQHTGSAAFVRVALEHQSRSVAVRAARVLDRAALLRPGPVERVSAARRRKATQQTDCRL